MKAKVLGVVTGHNFIHLTDDVRQFGAPDNFWCFTFERAVKRYVHKSTNNKHIECTFAKAEERRELQRCLQLNQFQRRLTSGRTIIQDTDTKVRTCLLIVNSFYVYIYISIYLCARARVCVSACLPVNSYIYN